MGDQFLPFNNLIDQGPLVLEALNSSVNGIIIIDHQEPNDPIIYCNPAFEKLTGYVKKDILGQNCRFLQGDDRTQEGRFEIKEALKNNQSCVVELLNYRKDGSEFWNEVYISPVKNDRGVATHFIGIQNDISERKLGEIRSKMALIHSKKLEEQKDDFIGIASHELKTPLTSLKATLQLLDKLKNEQNNPVIPTLITQANKSINKVSTLVDDLLNSDNLKGGALPLNTKRFVISKALQGCCDVIRSEGEFNILFEGDQELTIVADAGRIVQVIDNFVNNAVKYAPESKEIVIKINREGQHAKVSVTDRGKGIATDVQEHLFDRYYQVELSGERYSGLGLGLYISAEIIKRHKGEIGVQSEPGKGSTFWFTLPL